MHASEMVDALTEARDHVHFIRSVFRHIQPKAGERSGIISKIREIEERMNDPRLYLAVIGEFNSGKSTLVNALLNDALLTSNPWPTTQATTRVQHGDRVVVRCDFRDDNRRYVFRAGMQGSDWRAFATKLRSISGAPVAEPSGVPELLALLTAEEGIARAVEAVTIDHPAPVLADNLVIIDTPGTNAEAGHTEITQRVLAGEADAAVVLLAADNPLGETLASFLTEALDERLLARCVFVVTKMVHVDEGDERALLDSIRRRIQNKLGVADPVVLPVSVGCVVKQLHGKETTAVEQRWITRFAGTVTTLTTILARRRVIDVSDRVLRLLAQLLEELRHDLELQSSVLKREEEALNSSGLVDLDSFVARRRSLVTKSLDDERRSLQAFVDQALQGFDQALISEAVAAVAGPSSTRDARLESVVTEQLTRVEARCKPRFTAANRAANDILVATSKAFAREYAKLAPLTRDPSPNLSPPSNHPESATQRSLADVRALTARQDTTEKVLMGGGAAAGAVIGTMVIPIPVLGTAVGALVGAGSVLFGSARRERELREQLRTSMQQLASGVRHELMGRVTALGEENSAVATRQFRDAAAHYRPLLRQMMDDHQKRQRTLHERRRELDAEIVEIGRRRRRVAAERERLATLQRRQR